MYHKLFISEDSACLVGFAFLLRIPCLSSSFLQRPISFFFLSALSVFTGNVFGIPKITAREKSFCVSTQDRHSITFSSSSFLLILLLFFFFFRSMVQGKRGRLKL